MIQFRDWGIVICALVVLALGAYVRANEMGPTWLVVLAWVGVLIVAAWAAVRIRAERMGP